MPRSAVTDLLQVFPFWLLDAAPVDPLALPILTPLFGFSAITAPEITVDQMTITEGNWYFKKKVIKGADSSNMTLQRGATFLDADFWRWTLSSLQGDPSGGKFNGVPLSLKIGGVTPRRTFLLIQFISRNPFSTGTGNDVASVIERGALAAAGAALAGAGGLGVLGAAAQNVAFSAVGAAIGPFEFAARIPARAWLLHGVLPARYKPSNDFDASSSAISIVELEISVEMVEEISLLA